MTKPEDEGPKFSIVDALAALNRKERYWLLRNTHGKEFECLDCCFLRKLEDAIGFKKKSIPDNAWWAMDYHFDWIASVIYAWRGKPKSLNELVGKDGYCNSHQDIYVSEGNQQDVDLIIAYGQTIIMIEAKAATGWKSDQLESKGKRLENLDKLASNLGIDLHFVMMSPGEPKSNILNTIYLPEYACKSDDPGKPNWLELEFGSEGKKLFSVKRSKIPERLEENECQKIKFVPQKTSQS